MPYLPARRRAAPGQDPGQRRLPGLVATEMGCPGGRPIAEGAASVLWAVDLPDDGATGGFIVTPACPLVTPPQRRYHSAWHTAWPSAVVAHLRSSLALVVILTVIPPARTAANQTTLNGMPSQPELPRAYWNGQSGISAVIS
jgi:hypothetical protein